MTDWMNKNDIINKLFHVLTNQGRKRVSLWDNTDKKYVNEGDQVKLENGTFQFSDALKLSNDDRERYSYKIEFIWEVTLDGTTKMVGLPKTVNDSIVEKMQTAEELGQNPHHMKFLITKTGKGIETRYSVIMKKGDEAEVTGNVSVPYEPPKPNNLLSKPAGQPSMIVLTDEENGLFKQLEQVDQSEINEETFRDTMNECLIEANPIRVDLLWKAWNER